MKLQTNELSELNVNNVMKGASNIDLLDDEALYVHVGGHVIYIDNSTGEMIVTMFKDGETTNNDIKVLNIFRKYDDN